MKKEAVLTIFTILSFTALLLNCSTEAGSASQLTEVAVSISPQVEFVEAIGGGKLAVTAMIPPGANPHTYEPVPSQIKKLSLVKMYAKIGSGIEFELAWMDKLIAANRTMYVVDCSENVNLIQLAEHNHAHAGAFDPHIWLSPANVKIMLENIYNGIVTIDPANEQYYASNFSAYRQQIDQLDEDIRKLLSPLKGRAFISYHPAFAYFARDYGLQMLAIEEEGKEPSAADIANIIQMAKEHDIKVVIVSPQFNTQSAEIIADQIHGRVLFVDHLSQKYIENLKNFALDLAQNG